MSDLSKLEQHIHVDRLVQLADKEELAECARLLAMKIAHYEMIYGELPLEDRIAITYATYLNDHQTKLAKTDFTQGSYIF